MKVHDALASMNTTIAELQHSKLYQVVNPKFELRPLVVHLEELQNKIDREGTPKSRLDAELVWQKWRNANFEYARLDPMDKRSLCISPITAMRSEHINELLIHPETLHRSSTLFGFVMVYFALWRTMDNPEQVEKLIIEAIARTPNIGGKGYITVWADAKLLFSSEAAKKIAQSVILRHSSIKEVCAEKYVDTTSKLAILAQEIGLDLAIDALLGRYRSMNEDEVLKEFSWITTNLITENVKPDIYRFQMQKLILSELPKRHKSFATNLLNLILNDQRLGDPRVSKMASNWRNMDKEAKENIISWHSKDMIKFFFNALVPPNDENRRRADFWLKYAEKIGRIKDFQVAVSDADQYIIRKHQGDNIDYSRVEGGNSSAFLMVFQGFGMEEYVIIEFSETGNAAYIHKRKNFEVEGISLRSKWFNLNTFLKRKNNVNRIIHNGEWEYYATQKLAELGIRP